MSYPQSPTPSQAPAPARNGFGITALVLALAGVGFGIIPLTGILAMFLGALALVFGVIGIVRARKSVATNGVMAWISTVLAVAAVALGIWGMVIMGQAVEQFDKDMQEIGGDFDSQQITPGGTVPAEQNNAAADVAIDGCSVREEYGMTQAEAEVVITNSTDGQATYFVSIGVDDAAGDRLGEILAVANNLQSGQSTTLAGMEASTMLDGSVDDVNCSVVRVDRSGF